MASKILVIISTAEKEKALTGIMYAVNAQKNGWVDEVRVVFFGPFENLVCEDEEVAQEAEVLRQAPGILRHAAEREANRQGCLYGPPHSTVPVKSGR